MGRLIPHQPKDEGPDIVTKLILVAALLLFMFVIFLWTLSRLPRERNAAPVPSRGPVSNSERA